MKVLPQLFLAFLGLWNPEVQKIFCRHCDTLRLTDPEAHERAAHNSHDGRVFMAYRVGSIMAVRLSRGRDRGKWVIIRNGGMFCENGHWTGIDGRGRLYCIEHIRSTTLEKVAAARNVP